jgi:hypothetical protein
VTRHTEKALHNTPLLNFSLLWIQILRWERCVRDGGDGDGTGADVDDGGAASSDRLVLIVTVTP